MKNMYKMPLNVSFLTLLLSGTCLTSAANADEHNLDTTNGQPLTIVIDKGHWASQSLNKKTTIGKLNTEIIDTPRSIDVITKEDIDTKAPQSLADALITNVPNASLTQNGPTSSEEFALRGFMVDGNNGVLLNGMPHQSRSGVDMFSVERIDVLRGPGAALYGQGNAGGTINIITKQPSFIPEYRGEVDIGSYGYKSLKMSATGPIKEYYGIGSTFYLAATIGKNNTFKSNTYSNKNTFTGGLLFVGHDARLNIDMDYIDEENNLGPGRYLPSLNGRPVVLPIKTNFGTAGDKRTSQTFGVGYRLNYILDDNWEVNNAFRYEHTNFSGSWATFSNLKKDGTYTATPTAFDIVRDEYKMDINGVNTRKIFNLNNKFVIGADYRYSTSDRGNYATPAGKSFNIFDQNTYLYDWYWTHGNRSNVGRGNMITDNYVMGVYLQDNLQITNQWSVDTGLRMDYIKQDIVYDIAALNNLHNNKPIDWKQDDFYFSPNIGITYKPMPNLAFYVNYATSVEPQSPAYNRNMQAPLTQFDLIKDFSPQESEQYEIGMKSTWFNNKLTTTLALFDLTKKNIQISDLDGNIYTTGKVKNRGIEASAKYWLTDEINIHGYYVINDPIIKSDPKNNGNRFVGMANRMANIGITYSPNDEWIKGFEVGTDMRYVGNKFADSENTVLLPSYIVTDAFVSYDFNKNIKAQFNARNLFNQRYYASATSANSIYIGEPQTFIASVKIKW